MKFVRLLALVAGAFLLCIPRAFALSGPIALSFASAYTAPDGSVCTHRGVDVAMEAGESVTSPAEGTVTFAGRIPGPQGGSVLAVTIAAGGSKVTLLPLEGLTVAKGDSVAEGDELGACAEDGDPSTAAPHVHLSQRAGEVYVDPAGLLAPAAVQTQVQSEPAEAPASEPTAESAAPGSGTLVEAEAEAGAGAPSARDVSVPSASGAPAPGTSHGAMRTAGTVSAVAAAGMSSVAAGVASGAGERALSASELEPGVSLVPAADAPAAAVSKAVPAGASPVARTAQAATKAAAPAVRFAAGHLPLSLAVLAAVVFGSALLITRRALTRKYAGGGRVRPAWDDVAAPVSR